MRKKVGILKRMLCLLLIFLLSINSFAAIVSDNDGSAFITKAEFDALKSSFQAQIDTYNQSIDSKIDGAIASYLAGIRISSSFNLENIYEKYEFGPSLEPLKWYATYTPPWYETIEYGLLYADHSVMSKIHAENISTKIAGCRQIIDWNEERPVFFDDTKGAVNLYKAHTKVGAEGTIAGSGYGDYYWAPWSALDSPGGAEAKTIPLTFGLDNIPYNGLVHVAGAFRASDFNMTAITKKVNYYEKQYNEQLKINPLNSNRIAINVPYTKWGLVKLSELSTSADVDYYQLNRYPHTSSVSYVANGYNKQINGEYYCYSAWSSYAPVKNWQMDNGSFTKDTTAKIGKKTWKFDGLESSVNNFWKERFITDTTSKINWQSAAYQLTGPAICQVKNTSSIYTGEEEYWDLRQTPVRGVCFCLYDECFESNAINELVIKELKDICVQNEKLKYGVVVTKNTQGNGKVTITYQVNQPGKIFFYKSTDQTDGKYGTSTVLTPSQAMTNLGSTVLAGTLYQQVIDNCNKGDWIFVMFDPDNDNATITIDSIELNVEN